MRTRRLIVATPEGERELLFIGRLTVGRAPECDISLADTKISRRHAEFDGTGPVPRVTDLGSRNGILVNGRKVGSAEIAPGDVVTVGDARIRFEERLAAGPAPSAAALDDRTAVLPHPAAGAGPAPSSPPPDARSSGSGGPRTAPAASPVALASSATAESLHDSVSVEAGSSDRTMVLPRPGTSPAPIARGGPPPPSRGIDGAGVPPDEPPDDRTAVLPRPVPSAPRPVPPPPPPPPAPAAAPPAALPGGATIGGAGSADVAPARSPALAHPAATAEQRVHAAPSAPSAGAPPASHAPPAMPQSAAAAYPAASAALPAVPAADRGGVPGAGDAAAPPPAAREPAAGAAASAPKGPRLSWGGLVTLSTVALAGLAVLLGVMPLMSSSSASFDALSRRQARTLAGWLASGVAPDATTTVAPSVLEDVLAQPGVDAAVVLDAATGRAVAPARLVGRTFADLPGIGSAWRTLEDPAVGINDTFADAYVPTRAGVGRYVAWVRYERTSAAESGLAVVVALLASLLAALLIGLLIKRHTRATLQHFTRQVELAVSGANARVMQGQLMPGLERLPGVVTYLLEQRKAGAMAAADPAAHGWASAAPNPGAGRAASAAPAGASAADGPAWLDVTPSLTVTAHSAHAPEAGVSAWAEARGRHLLDVLDRADVRNAVVQGLGALGMQPGSEVTVPTADRSAVRLRREPAGTVRVVLDAR